MKPLLALSAAGALGLLVLTAPAAPKKAAAPAPKVASGPVTGWLSWRGPDQNGTTRETGLPEKIDAKSPLWVADFPGQSTPVIANGRLYINGYLGEGPELQEVIACFDAETGKKLWDHRFNDFLSDTIYLRYSTSSPTIDAETGNVYMQGTQGLFACFTAEGQELWEHSMMEEFGRLTFPNSRTASPVVDRDLVITRGITANWGAMGPAGDRFYAFDKKTGELVWTSSPADRPQDNSFSHPLLTWLDGKRVLISATGDSAIVGLNARNGDPLFRFPVAKAGAKGGINAAVLRYKDELVVIHESENIDTSDVGRSAAYRLPEHAQPEAGGKPQVLDTRTLEVWRNPIGNLASSPCLAGNRLYEVTGIGEATAIDLETGKTVWKKKLTPEQRQSSPFYGDGKLYVAAYTAGGAATPAAEGPDTGGNGELVIFKTSATDGEIISRTTLEGRCYGSPVAYNGRLYQQTDRKLYCFGSKGDNKGLPLAAAPEEWPKAGPATALQIIPNEAFLKPGASAALRFRSLDANGFTVEEKIDPVAIKLEPYIPPTALVKAKMDGTFAGGKLVASEVSAPSAGAFMATLGELKGVMRGRILPDMPLHQDFESFPLPLKTGPGPEGGAAPTPTATPPPAASAPVQSVTANATSTTQNPELSAKGPAPAAGAAAAPVAGAAAVTPGPTNWNYIEPPTAFNYPPLPWNAARFKFEIRKAPGETPNQALCKTIDNKFFQRAQVFIGHPEAKNYTAEADLMTEGNKRKMGEIGLINQRYLIVLKGNAQQMEVNSNQERLRVSVPFKMAPNEWYHLKTRVDVAADGSGVVRGKAWKKGDPEPEAWTIEVPHKTAHLHGAPGIYSFNAQEQRAWLDNLSITANP